MFLRLFSFFFLDLLRLNCTEVFHYVAEKLRVYLLFENGNKSIKISKEIGAVYDDFAFDSTELLSKCSSNIAYSQTLVQDANDVFSLNSDALVPQMFIHHAVLDADKNSEPVIYNTLTFDNPYYYILSSTPDKEYLKKVHRLATGGSNCLIFMKCDKEALGRVLIACMMLGFYQTMHQESGLLTRSL